MNEKDKQELLLLVTIAYTSIDNYLESGDFNDAFRCWSILRDIKQMIEK